MAATMVNAAPPELRACAIVAREVEDAGSNPPVCKASRKVQDMALGAASHTPPENVKDIQRLIVMSLADVARCHRVHPRSFSNAPRASGWPERVVAPA